MNYDGAVTHDEDIETNSSQEETLRMNHNEERENMFDSDEFSDNTNTTIILGGDKESSRLTDMSSICSNASRAKKKVTDGRDRKPSVSSSSYQHPPAVTSVSSAENQSENHRSVDGVVGKSWHQKNSFSNDRFMVNVTVDVPETWQPSSNSPGSTRSNSSKKRPSSSSKKRYHKKSSTSSLKDRVKVNLIVDLRDLRRKFSVDEYGVSSEESEEELLVNEKHQFKILKPLDTVPIFYQGANNNNSNNTHQSIKSPRRSLSSTLSSSRIRKPKSFQPLSSRSYTRKSHMLLKETTDMSNSDTLVKETNMASIVGSGSAPLQSNEMLNQQLAVQSHQHYSADKTSEEMPHKVFPKSSSSDQENAAIRQEESSSMKNDQATRISVHKVSSLNLDESEEKKVLVAQDSSDSQSSPDTDCPKIGRIIYSEASEVDSDSVSLSADQLFVEASNFTTARKFFEYSPDNEQQKHDLNPSLIESPDEAWKQEFTEVDIEGKLESSSSQIEEKMEEVLEIVMEEHIEEECSTPNLEIEQNIIQQSGDGDESDKVKQHNSRNKEERSHPNKRLTTILSGGNTGTLESPHRSKYGKTISAPTTSSKTEDFTELLPTFKIEDFDSEKLFMEGLEPLVRKSQHLSLASSYRKKLRFSFEKKICYPCFCSLMERLITCEIYFASPPSSSFYHFNGLTRKNQT